jgi:hypothetical protein
LKALHWMLSTLCLSRFGSFFHFGVNKVLVCVLSRQLRLVKAFNLRNVLKNKLNSLNKMQEVNKQAFTSL